MSTDLPAKVYNVFKRELTEINLQTLEPEFYQTVLKAIEELKKDSQIRITVLQTIRILFLIRLKKEIDLIIRGEMDKLREIPPEEKEIIDKVLSMISQREGSRPPVQPSELQVTSKPIKEVKEKQKEAPKKMEMSLVTFLEPYSMILDKDFRGGPYNKGDTAHIPKRLAIELEKKGVVEIIEITSE
jgi:DNA replication initiation complex subunit (GINS family)